MKFQALRTCHAARHCVPCDNPARGAGSRDLRRAPSLQDWRVLSDNGGGVFNCPKIPTVRRRGVSCVLCLVGLYNRRIAPAPVFSSQGVAHNPVRGAGLMWDAPAVRPCGATPRPPRWGLRPSDNARIAYPYEYAKLMFLNHCTSMLRIAKHIEFTAFRGGCCRLV